MWQPDVLPAIFGGLRRTLQYVKQHSREEYSAACPECGGAPHANGEWPDRLRIFLDSPPRLWCRRCGWFAFADKLDKPADPQALDTWRKEQEQREMARKRSAERALDHLRDERLWERYHDALSDSARTYWRKRGIPDSSQDYWQLGWKDSWSFTQPDGTVYQTASATIPVFGLGWVIQNVKHRLVQPPPNRGKYLYELSGQKAPLFLCQPDRELTGEIIAVEGEIKAMVTQLHMSGALVVGLPGVSTNIEACRPLVESERIVLVMDPDSEQQAHRLATELGKKRCRILITPVKIDDGILAGNLGTRELRGLLRSAVPA